MKVQHWMSGAAAAVLAIGLSAGAASARERGEIERHHGRDAVEHVAREAAPARHGADDGANHDVGERGQHRGRGGDNTSTDDRGQHRGRGADDGANHDANDDRAAAAPRRGADDGATHDAKDDKGGGKGGRGRGGRDDGTNHA
ncbi:MAG TPA: hypothetical protein VHL34_12435 [Rhizomicrobium sp.]|nr:hypothetical protein [Rhizomicrobium sp.]